MSKKSIIIASGIISLIAVTILAFYIGKNYKNGVSKEKSIVNTEKNIDVMEENIIKTSATQDEVVLPNAKLIMKQYYSECGHTIDEQYIVPKDIVNMTKNEVEKYYQDWKVSNFSNNKVEIYKENNGKCEEHYIIKDSYGHITIYTEDDKSEKLVEVTEILTKYLSNEDKERLKNGVKVVGKKDLSIFLEDFE